MPWRSWLFADTTTRWKEMRFGGYKHYGISLIQADDFWELEKGKWVANGPYSGDLYPGSWQMHSFV